MEQTIKCKGSNSACAVRTSTFRIGLWHYFSILLLYLFIVAPVYAESKQDAEFLAMYAQAFGNKKKVKKKKRQVQVASIATPESQKTDMAALFAQAFGDKKGKKLLNSDAATSKTDDLSALYAKAFGKKITSTPSEINVDLRVNDVEHGEVTVYSNSQNVIQTVQTKKLLVLLEDIIKEHIFKRIKQELASKERTDFKALTMLGMKATYNSINLSLDLEINPSLRKPQVLSMRKKSKARVRDENKITASEISAFMNLYSNLGLSSAGDNEDVDLKMRLESSFSIGDVVFENTTDLRDKKLRAIKTTLTYDQPDKLKRFVVGSISTGNRNFQENLELNGFRISKEFFMNPEIQIRPKADETFLLETDSEVEVYINHQLHQRFYLDEGIYSLQDIGLYEGVNDIRIRIKDEFGKVTEKNSRQFYDSHLLKPELSLYAISVGVLSNKEAYRNNELLNKPLFSGYYQKGVTKNLSMSFDAQFTPDSYLLGAEGIASVALGSLKQSIAFSGSDHRDLGYAAKFEFKPNIKRPLISLDTLREDTLEMDKSIGSFLKSWTITGEYRSQDFAMLNEVAELNERSRRLKARLQTYFSLDLGNEWRGNLNLGLSDYYDADKSVTAAITASKRFNNGIRWSVGAHYDSDDDFSVNLQVSIPLSWEKHKRRKSLDLLVNSKDNTVESRLKVEPLSLLGKNSLSGFLEYRQNDDSRQEQLDLSYNDSRFELQLNARNRSNLNSNGKDTQRLNVGFNTSIACVGKHCATSYPINDSFALVSGPSNQERPIAINNGTNHFRYSSDNDTELPDNYTALIPKKGKHAVVPLDSYRYQRINIDEATLPNGYDPEKTEFEVFPRYHQGYLIKGGGEPATIVDGIMVDRNKKPLSFKGGQWIPQGKKGKTIAFFSNKAGRFRMPSVPAGKYKLEMFDYPDMQSIVINVPDKKGHVFDVGNVVVLD